MDLELGWKVLLVRGAMAVVFGIVAMAWPLETAIALALLWGIWALADGIGALAQAFWPGTRSGSRWLPAALGAGAVVVGLLAITSPAITAVALTWILGIWLVARGCLELAYAAFSRAAVSRAAVPRGLMVVVGVVDLVLGVLFAANPGKSAVGIAFALGLIALVWGLAFVALGLWLRQHETPDDLGAAHPSLP
jgi:uncharacterized membrane protein HdeD (DUF308 family)